MKVDVCDDPEKQHEQNKSIDRLLSRRRQRLSFSNVKSHTREQTDIDTPTTPITLIESYLHICR